MASEKADIGIIVLHFRDEAATRACMTSLLAQEGVSYKIILVNNDADEVLSQRLGEDFPHVDVVTPSANLGFSPGMNEGLKEVLHRLDVEYVVFANNDLVVMPDCLRHLTDALRREPRNVAAVGPTVEDAEGRVYSTGALTAPALGIWIPLRESAGTKLRHVRILDGCFLMYRRDVIAELGGFDPKYFANVEDIDLCLRTRDRGFSLAWVPAAKVRHRLSESKGGHFGAINVYLSSRNWIYLNAKRHRGFARYLATSLLLLSRTALVGIWICRTGRFGLLRAHLLGIADALVPQRSPSVNHPLRILVRMNSSGGKDVKP